MLGLETRARLKEAAQRLFSERGVEGVSIDQMLAAAGQRNKASLHYHFGTKLDLVRELVNLSADDREPAVEDLDLDVARLQDVLLDEHIVVAESIARLALAGFQRRSEISGLVDAPHALAAAACACLDQHRVTDGLGLARKKRPILVVAVVAGGQRYLGLLHQGLQRRFEAHRADGRCRRADEDHAGALAASAKSSFSDRKP